MEKKDYNMVGEILKREPVLIASEIEDISTMKQDVLNIMQRTKN